MFTHAIVRTPCPEFIHGIRSGDLGSPDFDLALDQHRAYVDALRSLSLEVSVLEPDGRFPDSTFVEDVALCTPEFALVTKPGADSRKGEERGMDQILGAYFEHIEYMDEPGTLEAGDVMMAGTHFYIGISDRTNQPGAGQLIDLLEKYGMSGEKIGLEGLLHLKSGVSYLEHGNLLVVDNLAGHPAFQKYRKIKVSAKEAYAANSLWINGTVLLPAGYPETRNMIEQAGYRTLTLDVSEFQKLDGGLSCLSLRF